jgi:16S rRNA A1518/A1519 N6-dimethyltransferase RsmA/KsgA/DIM1 with predicted DNA glycosylase/AP lyase activity
VTGGRVRAALAQNLFRTDAAARRLVASADVLPGEQIYDLGAGTGRVTAALVTAGASVVAVERDANLAAKLRARFRGAPVRVVECDLRSVRFKAPFKVVANLPFNVTAAALSRLLWEDPAPASATLVLQREAAEKYAGWARLTTVSLAAQPWFEVVRGAGFARSDFVPAPKVDVAMLHIVQRSTPRLDASHRQAWRAFVRYALARPSPEARAVFQPLVSRLQWRRLCADLQIEPDATRDGLSLGQWLGLYHFVRRYIPPTKRRRALSG